MRQEVQNKIIEAARKVFYEKGYSGATMRDIAKTADVNLALLHYYFRTKDAIFEIVLNNAFALLYKKLRSALESDNDIFGKIKLMVLGYITTAIDHPLLPSFVMRELAVNPSQIPAVINLHKSQMNEIINQFYNHIREAGQKGIIWEIQPEQLCMDIQALSLYPYIAKNLLIRVVFAGEKEYKEMIKTRVESVSNFIINNLKL